MGRKKICCEEEDTDLVAMAATISCALSSLKFTALTSSADAVVNSSGAPSTRWSLGLGLRKGSERIRCAAEEGGEGSGGGGEDDFEARLAKLQRKATSGTGKKAELRKARKEGTGMTGDVYSSSKKDKSSSKGNIMLPPVQLKEPMSDGLQVEMGFNSYTERLNGRFAALGLAAVLLVELATGSSFIKYHDVSTIATQAYTMLAAAALFVKLEKEKVSVWPKD